MKILRSALLLVAASFFANAVGDSHAVAQEIMAHHVVTAADVNWEQLNPKRGDASPKAATLWGDRNGSEATGFLVKFVDGFSSPAHIHNVSYRGVVINGLVHNDDPKAAPMWMPPGSFWTQPAGEVHITSAKGRETVAYIEIEQGPYLVMPVEQQFDRGERPVNVDPSNIVWLNASNTNWIDQSESPDLAHEAQIAFLWGNPKPNQLNGTLIKLPAGFTGEIRSQSDFKAVVIEGKLKYQANVSQESQTLSPGSYFSSTGETMRQVSSDAGDVCIIYVRSQGEFRLVSGS